MLEAAVVALVSAFAPLGVAALLAPVEVVFGMAHCRTLAEAVAVVDWAQR